MKSTVITEIIKNDLCIGCGICAALCPRGLLKMKWNRYGEYVPIEITSCEKECGLCMKVCPFADHEENEDTIGKKIFGSTPGIMHRPETGYYLSAYVGYADDEHRSKGASGGMATWLLERLLEEKIVDNVICVVPNDDPEKLFSFKIFDSSEKVRSGAGSVYYPVEMSDVIKYIIETAGKYAIIGLPCFIKAIRLAQINNKKLNERIIVVLGLVCGQMKNKYFTNYIANLAGIKKKIIAVRYRGKSMDKPASNYYYIFTDFNGEKRKIFWNDGISEAWGNRWFTPNACNYCDDVFSECADATFMDAWLPEYSKDGKGTSIVLIRSPIISNIINNGILFHRVFLNTISIEKVLQSQEGVIEIKRQHLSYRLYLNKKSKYKTPNKRVEPLKLKNPLLRHEIVLKDRMQRLSKDIWDYRDPDLKHFIIIMQPYLMQIKILKLIMFPIRVIIQKMQRLSYE